MSGPLPNVNAPVAKPAARKPRADIQALLAEAAADLGVQPENALQEALKPHLNAPPPRGQPAVSAVRASKEAMSGGKPIPFHDRHASKPEEAPAAPLVSDDKSAPPATE